MFMIEGSEIMYYALTFYSTIEAGGNNITSRDALTCYQMMEIKAVEM